MEMVIFYDAATGQIWPGQRNVTRPDDVKTVAWVDRMLAKYPERSVLWLPNGDLPDPDRFKYQDGGLVEKTTAEIEPAAEKVQILAELKASDSDMARIAEDLIDAGGDPALLPQAALDKIAARKALRARLAALA